MNARSRFPEINAKELEQKLKPPGAFILLDVREPDEIARVHLEDERVTYAPLSELARKGLEALPQPARDPAAEIVVFCHQGSRSMQVALWLQQQGWQNITSLQGGIDAYAIQVDPSIGRY